MQHLSRTRRESKELPISHSCFCHDNCSRLTVDSTFSPSNICPAPLTPSQQSCRTRVVCCQLSNFVARFIHFSNPFSNFSPPISEDKSSSFFWCYWRLYAKSTLWITSSIIFKALQRVLICAAPGCAGRCHSEAIKHLLL